MQHFDRYDRCLFFDSGFDAPVAADGAVQDALETFSTIATRCVQAVLLPYCTVRVCQRYSYKIFQASQFWVIYRSCFLIRHQSSRNGTENMDQSLRSTGDQKRSCTLMMSISQEMSLARITHAVVIPSSYYENSGSTKACQIHQRSPSQKRIRNVQLLSANVIFLHDPPRTFSFCTAGYFLRVF